MYIQICSTLVIKKYKTKIYTYHTSIKITKILRLTISGASEYEEKVDLIYF